jgi:hypothetical protein
MNTGTKIRNNKNVFRSVYILVRLLVESETFHCYEENRSNNQKIMVYIKNRTILKGKACCNIGLSWLSVSI